MSAPTKLFEGGVFLDRRILRHLVFEREDFFRAWVMMLLLANDKARTVMLSKHQVQVQRGQLCWSMRGLRERLNKGQKWMDNFVSFLEEHGMACVEPSQKGTIITLLNYNAYNDVLLSIGVGNTNHGELTNESHLRTDNKPVEKTSGDSNDSKQHDKRGVPDFAEIPDELEIAEFCNNFTDLARGITKIPEAWWRSWLAYKADRFPRNWKLSLKQDFLSDFIRRHPKAIGESTSRPEQKTDSSKGRERGELLQLIQLGLAAGEDVSELRKELAEFPPH